MNIFWELHSGLPRQGPGCNESSLKALGNITGLPEEPKILDIGCGPGAQTLALARATQADITAVDTHQPFLDELSLRAAKAGLSNRIRPVKASMSALPFPNASFDLLWAEGSIYIMGFAKGLREWKRLLKPGGAIAVTEISWLTPDIPEEAKRFWKDGYPAMSPVEDNLKIIKSLGFSPVSHFTLPESAWWNEYYTLLEERLREMRSRYADNPEVLETLNGSQAEIDLFRKYSRHYGYVFYIARFD